MELHPQRVTFAALATWPVSTAALPSVNKLEETPMFSELVTCDLELTGPDHNGSIWIDAIQWPSSQSKGFSDDALKKPWR